MLLTFLDCSLDTRRYQLRRGGAVWPVEPLVFDFLVHLATHRDRTVGREELLDRLWHGKVVTDAALSTCVKSARRAIGDDGHRQACIATVPRRGYRFLAPVQIQDDDAAGGRAGSAPSTDRYASVVVMPLRAEIGAGTDIDASVSATHLYGLTHDLIARLARLRSTAVIAHGSVLALQARGFGALEAAQLLQADYVVSGAVRLHPRGLAVDVELADAHSNHVLWDDTFVAQQDHLLEMLDDIGHFVVANIASEVEAAERARSLRLPAHSLNAWLAYHRGLGHMYRFERANNEQAQQFFQAAIQQAPSFAPAHAGLSFTHFQNAFQSWGNAAHASNLALQAAQDSLAADDRQPAAHLALGRAYWLLGRQDDALQALQQTVELSPSFALAHYSLAFVQAQAGDPQAAIGAADRSRRLSPHDPLLFGMLGARVIALLRLGQFADAADWAIQAAAQSNAHAHIRGIAACSLALAGRQRDAQTQLEQIRRQRPTYRIADLLAAFRLDAQTTRLFRDGLRQAGLG
jgi:DNA-binding winged helix-turn-helix (wHTH) protein/Flp pilus assembly protein TadD